MILYTDIIIKFVFGGCSKRALPFYINVASLAKGAACPAAELMRRDEWFAGQPLRVREPFEERNTGAPYSRLGRGFSRCPRRGRELG